MGCMTDTFSYPPLRAGLLNSLVSLKEQYDLDENFLANSPYENEAKEILKRLFQPKIVETIKEVEVVRTAKAGRGRPSGDVALSADAQEEVLKEVKDLIKQLNELDAGDKALDTGERVKIINTKSNLIERLVKMQERVFNVKRMSDFQDTVITILDDLVSEKDRTTFLKRLGPFRE